MATSDVMEFIGWHIDFHGQYIEVQFLLDFTCYTYAMYDYAATQIIYF